MFCIAKAVFINAVNSVDIIIKSDLAEGVVFGFIFEMFFDG